MANSGKNSNTSQFFITLADSLPQLDGKHVIFGELVSGAEILDQVGEYLSPIAFPFLKRLQLEGHD
jgi:cyclophilin family peptidyl-prolyl cis-trans isomerase